MTIDSILSSLDGVIKHRNYLTVDTYGHFTVKKKPIDTRLSQIYRAVQAEISNPENGDLSGKLPELSTKLGILQERYAQRCGRICARILTSWIVSWIFPSYRRREEETALAAKELYDSIQKYQAPEKERVVEVKKVVEASLEPNPRSTYVFEDRSTLLKKTERLHDDLQNYDLCNSPLLLKSFGQPSEKNYDPFRNPPPLLQIIRDQAIVHGIGRSMVSVMLKSIMDVDSDSIKCTLRQALLSLNETKFELFNIFLSFCMQNSWLFMRTEIAENKEFKDCFISSLKPITEKLCLQGFFSKPAERVLSSLHEKLLENSRKYYHLLDDVSFDAPVKRLKHRVAIVSHNSGFGHKVVAEAMGKYLTEKGFEVLHVHLAVFAGLRDDVEKTAKRLMQFAPGIIFNTGGDRTLWENIISHICCVPVIDVETDYCPFEEKGSPPYFQIKELKAPRAVSNMDVFREDFAYFFPEPEKFKSVNSGIIPVPKEPRNKFLLGFPTRFEPIYLSPEDQLKVRKEIMGIHEKDVLECPTIPIVTILSSSIPLENIKTFAELMETNLKPHEVNISYDEMCASPVRPVLMNLQRQLKNAPNQRIHIHIIFGRGEEERKEFANWVQSLSDEERNLISFSVAGFTEAMDHVYAATTLIVASPSGATSAEILQQKGLKMLWVMPSGQTALQTELGNATFFNSKKIGEVFSDYSSIYHKIVQALSSDEAIPQVECVDWKKNLIALLQKMGIEMPEE